MTLWIQRKQIRLQISHNGWTPDIVMKPDMDLAAPQFRAEVVRQFEQTRRDIDALLGAATA
jgi:hypothetical protein